MNCRDWEQTVWLYLYDELKAEERAACETHLAGCEGCRTRLEEGRKLHKVLDECPSPEPAPELLVGCRQGLDEALDREQLGWRALLRGWFPAFAPAPLARATAVLTLVLFGFGLGWTLRPRATGIEPAATPAPSSSFMGADLANLRINSISQVAPDPQTGAVRITMDAERRVTLEGSLDDPRIRQVLVYAVKGYDNPGIRRDTLDALRLHTQDPSVREALMFALRHDPNTGVRLEALKTVQTMECDANTHRGLLSVAEHDSNVGVRAAAIDALIQHMEVEGNDEEVLAAFKQLALSDKNPYVRFKCVSALQRLAANELLGE